MEKTAPETKIPTAASSDQKNRSLPYPNGWVSSAGCRLSRSETSRKSWFVVSATECAPSASIALEPLSSPAVILATAIPRFAASATSTVPVLSSSLTSVAYPGAAPAVWKSGRRGHRPAHPARADRDDRAGARRPHARRTPGRARAGAGRRGGRAVAAGAAGGRGVQPAGAVRGDRRRGRGRAGAGGPAGAPAGRGALRRLDRPPAQGAGEAAALEGGAAAPVGGGLPGAGGGGAGADPGPGGGRGPRVGRVGDRGGRAGGGVAGLQPRRRDQGAAGRRARRAPRPLPADRGRPVLGVGGPLHRDPAVRAAAERHRRGHGRAGAGAAAGPAPAPPFERRRGRRRRRIVRDRSGRRRSTLSSRCRDRCTSFTDPTASSLGRSASPASARS